MGLLKMLHGSKPANAQAKVKGIHWVHYLLLLTALLASFMAFTLGVSGQATVFGPNTYTRASGPPTTFQDSFIGIGRTEFTFLEKDINQIPELVK